MTEVTSTRKHLDFIPTELTERKQWVGWRFINQTKIPFQMDGTPASSTDPQTWTTFETAITSVHQFDGLGLAFSSDDDLIGIDLDACRDPQTGDLETWASEVVQLFATYTEVSPSQTGVKLFAKSKHKWNHRKKVKLDGDGYNGKSPGIEVYQTGRYFTVTGQLVGDVREVRYCDDSLEWLADRFAMRREQAIVENSLTREFSAPKTEQHATPIIERASKYLAKLPPAISGQNGSDALFYAACKMVKGFDLSDSHAMRLLTNEYNPRCVPPWSERELRHKVDDARKTSGPVGELLTNDRAQRYENHSLGLHLYDLSEDSGRTDAANAVRFIDLYSDKLLHVPPWHKWLTWDGKRWLDDSGVAVQQRAKRYAEGLWSQLGEVGKTCDRDDLGRVQTFIKRTNERAKISDFVSLASTDERIVCQVAELNANPMLLNCANGTIDLRTGELRKHDPADRITQLAPVAFDPNADCPRWLETLALIFANDAQIIRYIQQLLGYSISGDTGEHILPIAYGLGCNGKSTIWNATNELLGDYAAVANDDLLLGERANHQTEKASLYQKRFVAISEPEKNASLRESRVKELTGDRTITARRMHEDFWSFERTHTFWLSTNHLPRIDGTDEGIWRRVKLLPFSVDLRTKVEPIADFDRWLVANEGPGILAWLVRGFQDWRQNGFIEPSKVTQATRAYRDDSDALGDFLTECCIIGERGSVTLASELFAAYSEVFKGPWKQKGFGRAMAERFQKDKPKHGKFRDKVVYLGVRLKNATDDENPSKTRTSDNMGPIGTSENSCPIENANSIGGPFQLVPTCPISKIVVCKCGFEMVPSPFGPVGNKIRFLRWDCPNPNCLAVENVQVSA